MGRRTSRMYGSRCTRFLRRYLAPSLAALLCVGVAHAVGDAAAGKGKSVTCQGCHGADGNSANPLWPKLAGQHPNYIAKQLADFKSGARKDPTMSAMVAPLSEADMQNLAAFYSGQVLKVGAANEKLVAKGERIYRGGNAESGVAACIACHGPRGAGNPAARYPAVGGQHAAYVEKSLKDFKSGARSNDAGDIMQAVAARMTDAEVKAVAEYISGLH